MPSSGTTGLSTSRPADATRSRNCSASLTSARNRPSGQPTRTAAAPSSVNCGTRLEQFHSPTTSPTRAVEFCVSAPGRRGSLHPLRRSDRSGTSAGQALAGPRARGDQIRMRCSRAAVGLARQGDKSLEPKLLAALDRLDFKSLAERQQLDLLRTARAASSSAWASRRRRRQLIS